MRTGSGLTRAAGLALLLTAVPGSAQPPSDPAAGGRDARPTLPTVRLGALLPLSGASAWYGKEIRQGMELAVAELNGERPPGAQADPAGVRPADAAKAADAAPSPSEGSLPSLGFQLALEALDVQPLDVKDAAAEFGRLVATPTPVVFTASATPTLAIHQLAAAGDVLVVHQGLPTERFPATSRTFLHTRPTVGARVETLVAHAWERGVRRLALLAAGDDFGKAVRARAGSAWRARGGSVAREESLTLDAPDVGLRLRQLARTAPDAILLAFRGPDLGDLAARLRDAGYRALLLALDDDPATLLAAGSALDGALILAEAFVPEPGSAGERFALAYKEKFKSAPSRYAANAYDALAMVAEAIRTAREQGAAVPGGARLREALLARRTFPSVYGGRVVLHDDGTLERPLALFAVERGKLTFVRYLGPADIITR
ncbi:MAG: amino acid ABC transporter substrate-binding protein [Candidatus Rokubacteria bacterium]|nr:amino acid ABC transporter substrate-binding protein [Candidatus Rokubacteria bacterium]